MRIGIDYDGVESDSTKPKQILCRKWYGVELKPEQCTTEIAQHVIGRERYERIYRTIEKGELCLECEPVAGASENICRLAAGKGRIVTVTSLESRKYAKQFLEKHNIPYHHWVSLPYVDGRRVSKAEVMKRLKLDALVDDSYYNLKPASGNGKLLLFFRQPWNEHVKVEEPDIISVKNWDEAVERIEEYRRVLGR